MQLRIRTSFLASAVWRELAYTNVCPIDAVLDKVASMRPTHAFSDTEREEIFAALAQISANPYTDYVAFQKSIAELVASETLPDSLPEACVKMREERASGIANVHVLRNCPLDKELPPLSPDDPLSDKYASKQTFVGEAFVALVAELGGTPLLAYSGANEGRFFDDVIAITRYSGMQSAYGDRDLVYHNDRSAHWARPDLVALLAMRSPEEEVTYTTYVDGRELLLQLTPEHQDILRQSYFITDHSHGSSPPVEAHPILVGRSIRYIDTITMVAANAPVEARDALIALKNALVLGRKQRHRLLTGDLMIVENQEGLHCRDKMEIEHQERTRTRWLLKTYLFRDHQAVDAFSGVWHKGIRGLIAE